MNAARVTRYIALLTLCLIAGCGEDNNKIGTTIKGTRVSVMEESKKLEADADLKNQKPVLPPMIVNLSWPQAGYDAEHDMPYAELSPHPHILWTASLGEGSDSDFKLLAHPVTDKGVIYSIDAEGLVRAFDRKSGDMKWEFDTTPENSDDKALAGGLAIDGNLLYATTGFGEVIALDASKGALKWRRPLLKPLRAAPTVADHRVYAVSIDNELYALSASTGDVIWHQQGITESATLMGASGAAVEGDSVVIAYNSGELFGLRVQNGRASWNYSLAAPTQVGALPAIADIRGLPVITRDRVYAVSHSGRIASVEQRNGDRMWESDIGGIDTPVIAGDALFLYGGDGQLMALSRDSGRAMWVKSLPKLSDPDDKDSDRIVWAGPILAGERLWMVNSLGKLASYSPLTGDPIDSIDLGSPIYLTPIVADHTMYVATDDGNLVALR